MTAEAFAAETTTRLSAIENAIANYMMPDDGRTDRQIVSAIINMEQDIANRLNDNVLNALIDAKIISSANIIQETMIRHKPIVNSKARAIQMETVEARIVGTKSQSLKVNP